MTAEEFATVSVGDVLLAGNGRHMHIDKVEAGSLHFHWDAGVMEPRDRAGSAIETYRGFSYQSHISKGVQYGTHRTLRYKADFKTKP